jgi:organic radical activating enzyme
LIHVSETFDSFQGTGHLLGTRQFTVRFSGCSVATCPIRSQCDEPDSLARRGATLRSPEDLVDEAIAAVGPGGWLHITGGEPTDQPEGLQDLARIAMERGLRVHLQTSGVRRVPTKWDWLTCSPKQYEPAQKFGQELVCVDDGVTWGTESLHRLKQATKFWNYYLVVASGRDPEATLELAASAGWDMTLQAHKVWGVR